MLAILYTYTLKISNKLRVYKDKLEKIYTEKDYAPPQADLAAVNWSFDNARYVVEPDDFVASVPGFMTLEELDKDLEDWAMVSRLWAPAHYNISRILAEDWGHDNFSQILGLNLLQIDGSSTKTGGKVIKNVSGYDLSKLYLGSRNSLALIQNAFLRLEKIPSHQAQVKLELDFSNEKFFTNDLIDFLIYLAGHNFDQSLKMQMRILEGIRFILQINLSADEEMLKLRIENLATKLNGFFTQRYSCDITKLIKTNIEEFSKSYASDSQRIELHLANDRLRYFYTCLARNFDNLSIDLRQSIINIEDVTDLEAVLQELKLVHAEFELGPYFMQLYPVNYKNILLEKEYNPYLNRAEEDILLEIKRTMDTRFLLNAI